MNYPYFSRKKIIHVLKKNQAGIRKKWGQNFLIDPNYVQKIYKEIYIHIPEQQEILEIGPGLGALTYYLLSSYKVCAVEIDPIFCSILRNMFSLDPVTIICEDILTYFYRYPSSYQYIVGNLPYYITTDIFIRSLDSQKGSLKQCFFLVQREYAEKLITKNNSISIFIHNFARVTQLFSIPKESFFPVPGVESSLVHLEIHPVLQANPEILEKILRMSFRSKRKKILNSWKKGKEYIPLSILLQCAHQISFDTDRRAEEIPYHQYYALANCIETYDIDLLNI